MIKGDILLIPFPFTNLKGSKLRPAVLLIETKHDLTVCFISSQLNWKYDTDVEVLPSNENGIKKLL